MRLFDVFFFWKWVLWIVIDCVIMVKIGGMLFVNDVLLLLYNNYIGYSYLYLVYYSLISWDFFKVFIIYVEDVWS